MLSRGSPAAASGQLVAAGVSALAPLRAGDPLGLGAAPGSRPPPPPDPDPYDRPRENAEFSRSLLSEEERKQVDGEEFMSIAQVRSVIAENTCRGSLSAGGIDPEILALVDARIDYKIFVAGDNVYTREELYESFPFHEFGVQPEAIFSQQEIGVFPPRASALRDELEYVARDAGDETVEFLMVEDLVGMAARKDYLMRRAPLRVAKTKVFVGKERWEDFVLLQRCYRGAARISAAQIAYSGGAGAAPLAGLLGHVESAEERAAREAAREEEVARREAELRRREEENAALAARLSADLERISSMLDRAGFGAAAAAAAPAGGASEDSVAL